MFTIHFHSGPRASDPMAFIIRAVGSLDQIVEGARVKCGQAIATRGRVVWVEFKDADENTVYERAFCEDLLA